MDRSWQKRIGAALRNAHKIVILGVGNAAKGDDGAGIAAAAALSKRLSPAQKRRVRVILGGAAPEDYTGKIRTVRPGLVLILDSALGSLKPGSLFLVAPENISDDGVTTHQISLRWLVRYIEESIECPVLVLGIQPKTMEFGEKLSKAAELGVSRAVEFLLKSLEIPGNRPERR